jgi:uncharacterized repeat protein (TIGR03843 family)
MNTLELLQAGSLEIRGQFTWGSNSTFLVSVDGQLEAVYKPVRGEQPLWDFPDETLAGREVAAFLVSEALGWGLVPPTVYRADGPLGPGSLQLRVAHDPEQHYFTFDDATRQRLRPVALFDALVNNADRKGGHVLLGEGGQLWLIDHGICFHAEPKLRTVIWDFAGQPIPPDLLADVRKLEAALAPGAPLTAELGAYLNPAELDALRQRTRALLAAPVFPSPSQDQHSVPWPLV